MTDSPDASAIGSIREAGSHPPNWDNVPFDVACARCGQDIRGLTEPKCPACALEFDWAEAVPVERLTCAHCGYHLYGLRDMRCPECGEPFTWEEALTEYRRKKMPFFEYHWREHPFGSLISTCIRAFVPGRLWRKLDIHDPPQLAPLWVLTVVALLALAVIPLIAAALPELHDVFYRWTLLRQDPRLRGRIGIGDLISGIVREAMWRSPQKCAILGLPWCVASFASLMIFRQSMRHCKVLVIHVFRVWVYLVLPESVLLVTAYLLGMLSEDLYGYYSVSARISLHVLLAMSVYATFHLCQGYRHYLRMPHALGVALASQAIAFLAVCITLLLLVASRMRWWL